MIRNIDDKLQECRDTTTIKDRCFIKVPIGDTLRWTKPDGTIGEIVAKIEVIELTYLVYSIGEVAKAFEDQGTLCPVHFQRDCSPLLNGCSRLTDLS